MSILEGYLHDNSKNESSVMYEQYLNESINLLESIFDSVDIMSDDEILNENFIESISDAIRSTITYITKGREAMIKEAEEAAKEAYNYKDEIERIVSDNKKKNRSVPIALERYSVTVSTGNSTITYTETRNPVFTGAVLDFKNVLDKIANMDPAAMKKWIRSVKNTCDNVCRFSPYITKENIGKVKLETALGMVSKTIDQNKALVANYRKRTDDMLANANVGKSMLEKLTTSDNAEYTRNVIKGFKTLVRCQKRYYVHDSGLMHAYNKLIVEQSRHIRDKLKKAKFE